MEYAKFLLEGRHYLCTKASNTKMGILGTLFATDVRCNTYSYKQMLINTTLRGQGGNLTSVDKDGDHILVIDLYSEEAVPTKFKILKKNFIQLLDDWREKVCKRKPKEVTITYDGNQFAIETSDA